MLITANDKDAGLNDKASTGTARSLEQARANVERYADQAVALLADMLGVDTSYPPGNNFDLFADRVEPTLAELGFDCQRVVVPAALCDDPQFPGGERINIVASRGTGKPICSMYFHTDVVPPGDGWQREPFALTREDDVLYGRGAADTKGAVAAIWLALKAAQSCGLPLAYDVQLLLCTDEEGGRYPGIRYLAEQGHVHGHLLNFNGQAAARIWGGSFGSMDVRIEVEGVSAHSGEPWRGVNALEIAMPVLNGLMALKGAVQQRASDLLAPPYYEPGQVLRSQLTIAAVHAGGEKGSQVPGRCVILVNRRYAPHENEHDVFAEIQDVIAQSLNGSAAVSWHAQIVGHLAPVSDPDGPHWPRWQAALQSGFGFAPASFQKYASSTSSDMGWVQRLGTQEILLGGLIRPASRAHGPDEFTTVGDLKALANSVLCYLAAGFEPSTLPEGDATTLQAGEKKMTTLNEKRRLLMLAMAGSGLMGNLTMRSAWAQGAAQPQRGGTLRVAVDQAPSVIHPLLLRVNPEYLVAELLYSALTRLGPEMQALPDLALEWKSSDDLKTWTFTLRNGVTFHDGSPLTADDVVATFTKILDPDTASPARSNVGPIESVQAQDPQTVVFQLSEPYADLPVTLAYTNAKIIPKSVVDGDFTRLNKEAVGTGPFKLVSYEPARQVVVERNPDYYDPQRPYVDRVVVVVNPDQTSRVSALMAGGTDIVLNITGSDYDRVASAAGVVGLRTPSGQFLNVIMRCDQEPFNDPRVRKALSLAVDREALVQYVADGFGTVGTDTPINEAYRFYNELTPPAFDPDAARKLLAEAGHPNGLKLTLIASDRPETRTTLGVAMREMARAGGFDIDVQTMPHATYLDQVWVKGSFYVGFYNMQPTADAIFSLLYTSDSSWNETKWNNAEFDKLVSQARSTADEAQRRAFYAQAQQMMADEVPTVIPMFFDLLGAKRDYVQDFALHARGAVFDLDRVWLNDKAPQR